MASYHTENDKMTLTDGGGRVIYAKDLDSSRTATDINVKAFKYFLNVKSHSDQFQVNIDEIQN